MTTTLILTDDELHVIVKALHDAYFSTTYRADEIEVIGDLLDQLPVFN